MRTFVRQSAIKPSTKILTVNNYFNQSQNSSEISTGELFYPQYIYYFMIGWNSYKRTKFLLHWLSGRLSQLRKWEVLGYKIFYRCTFMRYFVEYLVKMQVHENKNTLSKNNQFRTFFSIYRICFWINYCLVYGVRSHETPTASKNILYHGYNQ